MREPGRPYRWWRSGRGLDRLAPRGTDRSGSRPPGSSRGTDRLPDHLLGEVVAALIDAGAPPGEALSRVAEHLRNSHDARAAAWAAVHSQVHAVEGGVSGLPAPPAPGGRLWAGWFVRPGRSGVTDHERFVWSLGDALGLASRAGLSPGGLLRECARDCRRAAGAATGRRLARLPVVLVLPMGLCLLPAAVLLGIAPVVLGLLAQLGT